MKNLKFKRNTLIQNLLKQLFFNISDYILAALYLLILHRNILFNKIKKFFFYFGLLLIFLTYIYIFCLFAFPYALLEIDFIIFKFFFKEFSYTIPDFFKGHFIFILESIWNFIFRTIVLTIYFIAETIGVPWNILVILIVRPLDFVLNIVSHIFVDLEFYESCFIDFFFFCILIYKDFFNFFFLACKLFSFISLLENIITSFCFLPYFSILFILFAIVGIYSYYFIIPTFIIWYLSTFNYLFFRHQAYKRMRRVYYFLHPVTKEFLNICYYEIWPVLKLTYGNIFIVIFGFIFIFLYIFFESFLFFFRIWNDILEISIREHDYDIISEDKFLFVKEEQCYYVVSTPNDVFYLNDWFHDLMLLVHTKIIMDTYQHHLFERYLYYGLNCMDYHLEFIRIFGILIYGYYFLIFYFLAPITFYFYSMFLIYSCFCLLALPFAYLKSFVMSKRYYVLDKWNFQDPRTYAELVYPHVKRFLLLLYNDYLKLKKFNFVFFKYYSLHLNKTAFLLKNLKVNINLTNILKILIYFFSELPINLLINDIKQYYFLLHSIFKIYYEEALLFERRVYDKDRVYLTSFENIYYTGCLVNWFACVVLCPTMIFYIFYFLNCLTTYKSLVLCGMLQIPCFFLFLFLVPFYSVQKDIKSIKQIFNKMYIHFCWAINYFILNFNYNLIINDFFQIINNQTKNIQYIHKIHNFSLIDTLIYFCLVSPFFYLIGWIRAKCLTTKELTNIEMSFDMRFYHGFFSYIFQYYAYKGFDDLCEEYLQFTLNYRFWIFEKHLELEKKNHKLILEGYIIHRSPLLNFLSWWLIILKDFRLKSTRHREIIQKVFRDINLIHSLKFKNEYTQFSNLKLFILHKCTYTPKIDFIPYKGAFLISYLDLRFKKILEMTQEYYLELIKNRILIPTNELLYFDTKKRLKKEKKEQEKKIFKESKKRNLELDLYSTLNLLTKYSEMWKGYSKTDLLLASSDQKAYLFLECVKKTYFNRFEEYLVTIPLFKYALNVGDSYLKSDSNYKYSYHIKKRVILFNYYENQFLEILKFKWYIFKFSCRPIIHFKIPLHFFDYRMISEFLKIMNKITKSHINTKKYDIDVDITFKVNNNLLIEINFYYFFIEE